MSNRHLVDSLADVRAQIKALQEREAELRDALLQMAEACGPRIAGDEWEAEVKETQTTRLDSLLARARLGPQGYDDCCKTSLSRTVRLKLRNGGA